MLATTLWASYAQAFLNEPNCGSALAGPAIAVVNPYSAGAQLASTFRKRGFRVYAVLAGGAPAEFLKRTYRPDTFDDTLEVPKEMSLAMAKQWLADRSVSHVLAGAEGSAATADELSETMKLATTNGTALSEPRGNKVAMAFQFEKSQLRTIPTEKINSLNSTGLSLGKLWLAKGPVVVKPLHSAGTEDVFICHTLYEIQNALNHIVGKKNILGERNLFAVMQPFVHGIEYNIDVVVSNGVPRLAWIWRYTLEPSPTSAHVVKHVDLIDPNSDEARRIGIMPFLAAKALGVQWGPVHLELFLDEQGPILLEAGARIGGGLGPLTAHATDMNIWELVADAYTDPAKFAREADRSYRVHKNARYVALSNFRAGRVVYQPAADVEDAPERFLRRLPSFVGVGLQQAHGAPAPITGSIPTALGFVQLAHEDTAVLDRDTETLHQWAKESDVFTRPATLSPVPAETPSPEVSNKPD